MRAKWYVCLMAASVAGVVAFPPCVQGQYVKTLGGGANGSDSGNEIQQTSDGGFVVTGSTYSFGAGDSDLLLAKYDDLANLVWIRSLGGSGYDVGRSVTETSDGGFVVIGYTTSFAGSDRDYLLAKFDVTGNHLWTKTLGGSSDDFGYAVIEAPDGGLVVSGMSKSYDVGDGDLLLTKFDASGNHLWSKSRGSAGGDAGESLIQTSDGGFVMAGQTWWGSTDFDLLLTKHDATGNHIWTRVLEGNNDERGYAVTEASDGGLVVTGYTENFGAGNRDLLIVKFDSNGVTLWARSLGGTEDDYGYSVIEVSDGGFVVGGRTYSFGAGSWDFLLAKFDSAGNSLWTRILGGADNESGGSVVEAADGELLATGYAVSFGAGDADLLLARFDSAGNSCLGEYITAEIDSGSVPEDVPNWTLYDRSPSITSPDPTITSPIVTITSLCDDRGPTILSIIDVDNDQGKQVRIQWHRCLFDHMGSPLPITEYGLWRRVDERGASAGEQEAFPPSGSDSFNRMSYPPGEWDFVGTVPARCESTYNAICPTLVDSTIAHGMHWSVFYISAMTSSPSVFFDSVPDSGYSLDNLAPVPPDNLRLDTATLLAWDESGEEDFNYFTVYGSEVDHLDETAELLGHTIETSFDITGHSYAFYLVTATDFAGNEGEEASVASASAVEDRGPRPSAYALYPSHPNPGRPPAVISFDLPEETDVSLKVFDSAGRSVATLVDRRLAAGAHTVAWDGVNRSGEAVPAGVYFCQMDAGVFSSTRKIMIAGPR